MARITMSEEQISAMKAGRLAVTQGLKKGDNPYRRFRQTKKNPERVNHQENPVLALAWLQGWANMGGFIAGFADDSDE
jgi:hypothetical protein